MIMIRIYTKSRHISKINSYLNSINLEHEIFTKDDIIPNASFELGVSYCYPKKISNDFENKNLVERHQMIYKALGELMTNEIHAFSMKTMTENEFRTID